MSTLVLGSYQYEVLPTDANGWNLTVSTSNTIPALSGGSGAPSGTPTYGSGTLYIDTTNYAVYVYTTAWNLITSAASNVTTVAGTTNQIFSNGTVGASTGAITLSLATNPVIPGTASMTLVAGTTAQRPASPTDGMIRYNTTEDVIEVYSQPYTTTVSPIAFQRTEVYRKRITWEDEFTSGIASNTTATSGFGTLNWTMTSTGTAANSLITATTDHPGVLSLGTGATSGNYTTIHLGTVSTTDIVMANQIEYFAFLVEIPTITTVDVLIGLGQDIASGGSPTTTPMGTNGVWFQFIPGTSANWQFFTRSGSTSAAAVNCGAVAASTWYLLEAFYNGTNWTPVVNGTAYTSQTTNIPTTAVNVGVAVQTSAASSRSLYIDWFAMYTTELGARHA